MSDTRKLIERIEALEADEQKIIEALLERLERGRRDYGPWRVNDGREYRAEAFAEVIDALHYCAAALVLSSGCACCGKHHKEEACA